MSDKKQKQQELTNKLLSLKEFAHSIKLETKPQDLVQSKDAMLSDYMDQLWKCVDRGKQKIKNRDFYACNALKQEPLTPNIYKNQFFFTIECPRPYVNFTVHKYHHKTDELELIWTLPDKETLNHYYKHRHMAMPEEYQFLKYIIEYKDGTLYKKMQALNGETPEKPSLIVHDTSVFN